MRHHTMLAYHLLRRTTHGHARRGPTADALVGKWMVLGALRLLRLLCWPLRLVLRWQERRRHPLLTLTPAYVPMMADWTVPADAPRQDLSRWDR